MKKFLITLLFSGLVITGFSQIYGPTTVTVGSTNSYHYSGPTMTSPYWTNSTGILVSTSAQQATVKWTTVGTSTLNIMDLVYPYYSYTITVTVNSVPLPPAPVATAASPVQTTEFWANWNMVTGAANYRFDVSTNSSFTSFVNGYNNQLVYATTTPVNGLNPGTTYYYRVRTVNASGTSVNSNTISVITLPSAPVAYEVYGMTITSSSFEASWSYRTGAAGYKLDVSTSSTFSSFVSGYHDRNVSGTSITVTGLCSQPTYYYRVRAYNASGNSAYSNTISVGLWPILPIPVPVAYPATNVTSTSFVANWSSVPCATEYRIQVSVDPSFYQSIIVDKWVTGTSYLITGLNPFLNRYYYRVMTEYTPSNIIVVNTPAAKGSIVNDAGDPLDANHELIIGGALLYPNPVKERLYIKGTLSNLADITIYSVNGDIIKQARLDISDGIDVNDIKQGLYLLKVDDGVRLITKTFIKE